jgi:hypothetical protein
MWGDLLDYTGCSRRGHRLLIALGAPDLMGYRQPEVMEQRSERAGVIADMPLRLPSGARAAHRLIK